MTTDDPSSFAGPLSQAVPQEQLFRNGSTCRTYLVRRYGKLLFKKQLKPEYKGMPQYVEAFRKEFEVGYRLDHPAMPHYVAMGDDDGCPYILEEYIDGDTLSDFITANPQYFRSRAHADRLIDELLSAFVYLHRHQVLFLDLKPDNVMITTVDRQLRLIDLGGCHTDCFVGTEETTKAFAPNSTANASASPDSEAWKPSFDIFLIGRLLQYCQVPPIYNKVIAKCLKDDPTERYDSVDSLRAAVAALRRRQTVFKISAIGVVVAFLAASLLLLIPQGQKAQRPSEATETATTMRPAGTSEAIPEEEQAEVRPAKIMAPPTSTPSDGKSPAMTTTAEARMARELRQAMDDAYKKYIAPLPKDSLGDVACVYRHIGLYMDCVNPVLQRLKKKYPGLQPQAVDTKFAEIYSRTVMPVKERADAE